MSAFIPDRRGNLPPGSVLPGRVLWSIMGKEKLPPAQKGRMSIIMAFDKAKAYLEGFGLADRIIRTEQPSATVAEAAEALGCDPGMIAKTLSFLVDGQPVLILADGLARIDNRKYKDTFGCKAKMIPPDQVGALVGHETGGVCPFGVNGGVTVCLDESLRKHETVYPAAGDDHSGVRLSIPELEKCSGYSGWIDVSREKEEGQ